MTRWPFLNILQGLHIKAKLSKMADFVDEIEIDKIRNTSEIFFFLFFFVLFCFVFLFFFFPFKANFFFYGLYK